MLAAQEVHSLAPADAAYLPGEQVRHVAEYASKNEPGKHGSQLFGLVANALEQELEEDEGA